MTSILVAEHGWCWLNAITHCWRREIVGWELTGRCRAQDAIAVIENAVSARQRPHPSRDRWFRPAKRASHPSVSVRTSNISGRGARSRSHSAIAEVPRRWQSRARPVRHPDTCFHDPPATAAAGPRLSTAAPVGWPTGAAARQVAAWATKQQLALAASQPGAHERCHSTDALHRTSGQTTSPGVARAGHRPVIWSYSGRIAISGPAAARLA